MNISAFIRWYIPKEARSQIEEVRQSYRCNTTLDEDGLEEVDYDLESDLLSELSFILRPSIRRYADKLFSKGDPDEDVQFTQTRKGDEVDIIIMKVDNGWIPSVRTSIWDAPASTIDSDCAVRSASDAFVWGFGDAITNHILHKGL